MTNIPNKCPECGGNELSWFTSPRNRVHVPEGRLRTNEVGCDFILGCDECSETIKVIDAVEIAEMMNNNVAEFNK